MNKILLVDAVGCLVNHKGKVNLKIKNLIEKFKNRKIVLTNANDKERKIFLKNVDYKVFTLKHKPNKSSITYYKKFLNTYNFHSEQLIYFEHNIDAVNSARKNGIITHHYDGNIQKLESFLHLNLSMKQSYPKKNQINFHYYPHHPIVIGVYNDNKPNFMPCVWNTALSYEPFLYGVAVRKERYTNKILRKTKNFSINFLDFKNVNLIRSIGRSSGKFIDKTKEFKIKCSKSNYLDVPILNNAYLSFECKKKYTNQYGTHTFFVGEIKLIHTENRLTKKTLLDISKISPTLYLGADNYITINKKSLLNLKSKSFHKSYSGKKIKIIS